MKMNRILVFCHFSEALDQKKVRLTLEEDNVLMESSKHAWRAFWIGFYVTGFAVWFGTRRLRNVLQLPYEGELAWSFRNSIIITSAIVGGGYKVEHSFGSSFEHILNQEGTQIQQELGNELVKFVEKYPRESENIMKQYVSKHFYLEKVFDDLSTDGPKQVWRYKTFFGDGASTSQRTSQSGSYSENTDLQPKPITVDNTNSAISGIQRRDSFSNKESTDITTMLDPFEWNVAQKEESIEDVSSAMSRRRHKRSHKHSHRRLISRREASTNMQHALADRGIASI